MRTLHSVEAASLNVLSPNQSKQSALRVFRAVPPCFLTTKYAKGDWCKVDLHRQTGNGNKVKQLFKDPLAPPSQPSSRAEGGKVASSLPD